MKYKVGDKVKVVKRLDGHNFDIEEVVTIVTVGRHDYHCQNAKGETWYLGNKELKLVNLKTKTIINSKSKKTDLREALRRLTALNDVIIWLYVNDGTCSSAKAWRIELLTRVRPVMIGDAEHVDLLEWMIESHKSFPSKNKWRSEFVKRFTIAAGL